MVILAQRTGNRQAQEPGATDALNAAGSLVLSLAPQRFTTTMHDYDASCDASYDASYDTSYDTSYDARYDVRGGIHLASFL